MEYITFAASLILTFGCTVLLLKKIIPILKSHKMGQKILDIGPRWHKSKEGTPTMGGLSFMIAGTLVAVCGIVSLSIRKSFDAALPFLLVFAYGLVNGLVGIIDDSAKLRHKANEGLTAIQKYALQLLVAILFLGFMKLTGNIETVLEIPFAGVSFDLSWGYYPIALLLLTGVVNSVNLNDGIDGLCSSLTLIVGILFSVVGFFSLRGGENLSLLGAILVGGAAGFLVYNFYPARVFMGDTGSLFFGGLVVGGAFLMKSPLLVVIYGIVYIVETVSVILQVLYFKATHGKRLFKMSPIHHHFEKCGWSEIKIVVVFSVITVLACVAAYFA